MSDFHFGYIVGVLKFDYKSAGYPDLKKIVEEWKTDPNFHHLMIRGVALDNMGIDFLYITKVWGDKTVYEDFKAKYITPLKEKYGQGLYATDIRSEGVDTNIEGLNDFIFVQKAIDFEHYKNLAQS